MAAARTCISSGFTIFHPGRGRAPGAPTTHACVVGWVRAQGRDVSGPTDTWAAADAYERYIGRWSRPVSIAFVEWLGVPPDRAWLDLGCGTGALSETIARHA